LFCAVGVFLAGLILAVNIAFYNIYDGDGEGARTFMPWGSAANALAAEDAFKAQDFAQAGTLAERSLDRALLNVKALRVLGFSRQARNEADATVLPVMSLAGRLGWRDTPTQLWLMATALQTRNYEIAVQRADGLIRRDQASDQILAIIRKAALDPLAIRPIVSNLVGMPSWRSRMFLQDPAASADEANGMEAIVANLQRSPAPATRGELWYYLDSRIRARDYDRAYRVWKLTQGNAETRWPHDPQFAEAARTSARGDVQLPFEWTFKPTGPASPRFGSSTAGKILLSGSYDPMSDYLTQIIHAPPGQHHLEISTSGANAAELTALLWKLTCLPGRTQVLGTPAPAVANGSVAYAFSIPAQGCAFQKLSLSLSPTTATRDLSVTINSASIS
jgi:hypothetical protein